MSEFEIEWSLKIKADPESDMSASPAGREKGVSQRFLVKSETPDTREDAARIAAEALYLVLCRDMGVKPEEVLHIGVKMLGPGYDALFQEYMQKYPKIRAALAAR